MHETASKGRMCRSRVIWLVHVAALATAAGVVLVLARYGVVTKSPKASRLLLLIWAGMALVDFPIFVLVRSVTLGALRKAWQAEPSDEDPTEDLLPRWQGTWIVGLAMAEALGLFALITYLITRDPIGLIAAAASGLVLLMMFPTRHRIRRFVEQVTDGSVSPD